MSAAQATHARRELAQRRAGGVVVTLFWSAHDNGTTVEIRHPASGETFLFAVPREHALDAFYHPFAHLRPASVRPATVVDG